MSGGVPGSGGGGGGGACVVVTSSMRLPMKPKLSPESTGIFPRNLPTAMAVATAWGDECGPCTFSMSRITFAGEKKCVPT